MILQSHLAKPDSCKFVSSKSFPVRNICNVISTLVQSTCWNQCVLCHLAGKWELKTLQYAALYLVKGKGKGAPITGHEGPEGV